MAKGPEKAIESAFHERMLAVYGQVGSRTGYWPYRFLKMVRNRGGLNAARHLLNDLDGVSDGFERLAKIGNLDFAVEALILRKPWSNLFSKKEKEIALTRLRNHDYVWDDKRPVGTSSDWTVLKHFVVYHNSDTFGKLADARSVVSSKSLDKFMGNRVWLLLGQGKPRSYFLVSTFIVDRITRDGPSPYVNRASGNDGVVLEPYRQIDNEYWFPEFLKANYRFQLGPQDITSHPEFVHGLSTVAGAHDEEKAVRQIDNDSNLGRTAKKALIDARIGQGLFKKRLMQIERCCRLTKISNRKHLIASHCKPWAKASNSERLDGNNGLLLSPNVDHLFNAGLISFSDSGDLLIAPKADKFALRRLGIETKRSLNVGDFNAKQRKYLGDHRRLVFQGI